MIGDHLSSGAPRDHRRRRHERDGHATRCASPDPWRVVLLGMPADVTLDLTGLWHRETELKGAYTYGTEHLPDGRTARTFDLAIETATAVEAERLLSATYPLSDHVDAIAHAATAGRRGAVKDCLRHAQGRISDAQTRIRSRRRSVDATISLLARRRLPPGEAAGRPQPRRSTRPSRTTRSTMSTGPYARRC